MTSSFADSAGTPVVWLTGLSGAGKSSLALALQETLSSLGTLTAVLDGDDMRSGLCSDLGFSAEDRRENVRRVAEVAKILARTGSVVIVALISPTQEDRALARRIVGEHRFLEVFLACPLEICEARDVKGLYRRARQGDIGQFTGISSPYEPPSQPDLVLDTGSRSLEACTHELLAVLPGR